ncbi:MAG: BrnT family toxin [Rhodocyclaceae bacterium]|nr:BrnT family toxin [Rhodocyclaceae bacterium]
MDIEFDPAKRMANIARHGVDFVIAANVLLDPDALDLPDRRFDYGEERRVCIGEASGRAYVLVYTRREGVVRVISARKANEREQARYRALRAG